MKKIIKLLIVFPIYLFLLVQGFFGGATHSKDIWDDLSKWINK